jgi:hypothetical protein
MKLIKKEMDRLELILLNKVTKSRQHFLRLSFPITYQTIIRNGITEDYTMGWPSHSGFRAGTTRPFKWFDLSVEIETGLTIFPFVFMDGTLNEYQKLNPDDAIDLYYLLMKHFITYNGVLVLLWHNHSLSESGHWKGWTKVYKAMSDIP